MLKPERRKEIYTDALEHLKSAYFFKGLCFFVQLSLRHNERNKYSALHMPEIMLQKPEGILGDKLEYWFPLNEEGKQERIKILENAILKIK